MAQPQHHFHNLAICFQNPETAPETSKLAWKIEALDQPLATFANLANSASWQPDLEYISAIETTLEFQA
ncbi:MAG TPA: hypothetical protein PK671_03695 [Candidatus Obscuribacter sp.]|nr:hypothetical protein [Candidatus Obscuribacter sp.]